ncbi:50S ribosomal protein L29 [Gemmatirosa kalamazoonensis]|uniref:Large ribosomal subunit protein uL29 n=1 Tax=Gemmatirosa kalamazoonensis TaxID=861299 RepID=W0RGU5_9BACT|nr:50S ribosomal protein L29 [Gemmatirosa kalamazoonensis]AHG90319.1 50S ribosomal protein L29 [Gemmatirosa kalamazoonensis]
MKREDIRSLSADELRARVNELREEQFRLRFRSATETLESPLRLREVRRDIARALTVLGEKDRGVEPAPKATAKTAKGAKTATKKTATKGTAKTATTKSASKRAAKTAGTKTAR